MMGAIGPSERPRLSPSLILSNPQASAESPPPYLHADSSLRPRGPRSWGVGNQVCLTQDAMSSTWDSAVPGFSTLGSSVLVYVSPMV